MSHYTHYTSQSPQYCQLFCHLLTLKLWFASQAKVIKTDKRSNINLRECANRHYPLLKRKTIQHDPLLSVITLTSYFHYQCPFCSNIRVSIHPTLYPGDTPSQANKPSCPVLARSPIAYKANGASCPVSESHPAMGKYSVPPG